MSESPAAHQARRAAAAADAMARGQTALAAGDLPQAARWLDRARRVAGGNDAVALLLATVLLRLADPAAAEIFAALAARHDLREAWLGLAQARLRAGEPAAAAAALHEALAGHAGMLAEPLWPVCDAIAAASGASGWCCRTEAGLRCVPPDADAARAIGLPFQPARMERIEGFVEASDGTVAGWAWHPNDPARAPALALIEGVDGLPQPIMLQPPGMTSLHAEARDRPLAQPRAFRLAVAGSGLVRVVDPAGRDLPGSPLDPGAWTRYVGAVTAAAAGRPAAAEALRLAPVPAAYIGPFAPPPPAAAPIAVVVPVYRGRDITLACLASVIAHTPPGTRLIVVDDAGPEPDLAAALDWLAVSGQIELIRHGRNQGFPAAANAGLRAAPGHDVVLLNADTLVPRGWLDRLRAAAHAAPDTGTATPLSNDATLLSYPRQPGGNPVPDAAAVARLDRRAARANGALTIEIPTAIGFCMYLRADCRAQVGLLREDVFAQGYGEENDYCLRARHLGWRHVAVPGLFVGHVGGVSFGAARAALLARNLVALNRLHPGYDALIAADEAGPALAAARRRIDLAALRPVRASSGGSIALLSHDLGGGVERQLQTRGAALRAAGIVPIVLRPIYALPFLQGTGQCRVELSPELPNLIFDTATELPALARLLAGQGVRALEIHHMIGHDHALLGLAARLAIPYAIHLHDYAWFCPRVTLVTGTRRYCGEPDLAGCEACIADHGSNTDEAIPVAALLARSARELAGAARRIAPSADVAARYARHFPGFAAEITPWDGVSPPAPRDLPPPRADRPRRVAVLGAIGIEKGYDILLACARDAAARALPLRFVVLGHTTDDARLLDTGMVFITGEYGAAELPGLIAREGVGLAFLPSVWPETWCFTLSEAWQADLAVVAFDLGTQAERIRAAGGGTLLPLACPPGQINATLLGFRHPPRPPPRGSG